MDGKTTNSHKMSELNPSQEKTDTHVKYKTRIKTLNAFFDTVNDNNKRLIDVTWFINRKLS